MEGKITMKKNKLMPYYKSTFEHNSLLKLPMKKKHRRFLINL